MNKVYSKIESITGSVITVRADDVRYGDLAEVDTVFEREIEEAVKSQSKGLDKAAEKILA